jgi:hypothetical protein
MARPKLKLEVASEWLRRHPDANESLAVKRGFSKATFYAAKRKLKGEQALAPQPDRDTLQGAHPLVHLILQMEERLGLVEFHYKDGVLEILQRRKVKVRDGPEK